MKRGQTAIEYLLFAGAVILFAVVVFGVVQNFVYAPGKEQANTSSRGVWDIIDQAGQYTSFTAITNCTTINSSGNYVLLTDVSYSDTCINITADNVSLDCRNHLINGTQQAATKGVYVESHSFTLTNCRISNYDYGLMIAAPAGGETNATLSNNAACNNSNLDISSYPSSGTFSVSGNACGVNKCLQVNAALGACTPNIVAANSNCSNAC